MINEIHVLKTLPFRIWWHVVYTKKDVVYTGRIKMNTAHVH